MTPLEYFTYTLKAVLVIAVTALIRQMWSKLKSWDSCIKQEAFDLWLVKAKKEREVEMSALKKELLAGVDRKLSNSYYTCEEVDKQAEVTDLKFSNLDEKIDDLKDVVKASLAALPRQVADEIRRG